MTNIDSDLEDVRSKIARLEEELEQMKQTEPNKPRPATLDNRLLQLETKEVMLMTQKYGPVPQPGPGAAKDSYIEVVSRLPCPSSFGRTWPDYQLPTTSSSPHSPPFNCLRPWRAKGVSAVLMHQVFGKFLDLAKTVELDADTIAVGRALMRQMSSSYANSGTSARGTELERARRLRVLLLQLMRHVLGDSGASTLEPSAPSLASTSTNDGCLRQDTRTGELLTHSLIIEVKEGVGHGGGSDPMMQMIRYYGFLVKRLSETRVVPETCYPVFGLEVIGNMFRVHALYYTDKICCEPLTAMLHFSDLRYVVPLYTETMMRTLKALMVALGQLREYYEPFHTDNSSCGVQRDPRLDASIPYIIRERYTTGTTITCVKNTSSKVYIIDRGASGKVVGKIASDHQKYPVELHKEAAAKGLAPNLEHTEVLPGGLSYVEMEFLDARDGWRKLSEFQGNLDALSASCRASRVALHACLDGEAVHGDLRPANILVRDTSKGDAPSTAQGAGGAEDGNASQSRGSGQEPVEAASGGGTSGAGDQASSSVQIKIIDWDWGGRREKVRYPVFINTTDVEWAITDPADKPITQEHDTIMMGKSLAEAAETRGHPQGAKRMRLGGGSSPRSPAVISTEAKQAKQKRKAG